MFSSKRRRFYCLLAPFLCLILLSCSPAIRPTALPEETLDILTPPYAKWVNPDYRKDALKAIARLDVDDGERRHLLKVALIIKHPAMIRMEGIPIIGPADFFLSLNSNTLKVFLPGKNAFYLGPSTRENISRFIPVDISPEDLVLVLMGLPPINGNTPRLYRKGEKHYLELFTDGKKIKIIAFEMDNNNLAKMEVTDADGEFRYGVNYRDYRRGGEIERPYLITLASKWTTLTFRYSEMEFDKVEDSDFDLAIPAGITPVIIDRESPRPPGLYD